MQKSSNYGTILPGTIFQPGKWTQWGFLLMPEHEPIKCDTQSI